MKQYLFDTVFLLKRLNTTNVGLILELASSISNQNHLLQACFKFTLANLPEILESDGLSVCSTDAIIQFDEYYREQLKLDVYWNYVGGKWREFSLKVLLHETGSSGEKIRKADQTKEKSDSLFQEDLYQVLSSIGESGVDFEAQKAIQQSILDQYTKNETVGLSAQDGRSGRQNSQNNPNWRNTTSTNFPSLQSVILIIA